jgi:hypothetical protein
LMSYVHVLMHGSLRNLDHFNHLAC